MKVLILKTFIFLLNVIYSFFKILKTQKKVVMISRQSNEVNDDFIKKGLNSLGGEYVKIAAQEGHRPKISKAYYNKELMLYLLHRNFISTYKEEENCFQINTRRNN